MYETFIDLDELITLCRDQSAKKFIQEAVACYRVGAYRSCIVSTWNAVVFDFLHKLRQLDQVGNGEASKLLQNFENMSQNSDVKGLWEFESNIPELAINKFELISAVEQADVKRLLEDRSRCAHPSMTSLEEPFEATAELARYHMRSAVVHLLQRPPVQGRSALNRIFEDIKSAYFPTEPSLAVQYFQKGPLARARFSLIKNIVIGLTVNLLTEKLPDDERERQFSGLNAVAQMYPSEVGKVLSENLSSIILDKVADEDWNKVITYLRKVTVTEKLNEACILKAKTYINKINIVYPSWNQQEEDILVDAAHIDFLRESVKEKLENLSSEEIIYIKNQLPNEFTPHIQEILKENIAKFINDFATSKSFKGAENNASEICKINSIMTLEQKQTILNVFFENNQIFGAYHIPEKIIYLFREDRKHNSSVEPHWLSFRNRLDEEFSDDFEEIKELIDSYIEEF